MENLITSILAVLAAGNAVGVLIAFRENDTCYALAHTIACIALIFCVIHQIRKNA
jgi:hypothetical protein